MLRELLPALRATLVLATLTGIVFPFLVTAFAQLLFPSQANGSLIRNRAGLVIGSRLIGQQFIRPEYFHPRPSAAGAGYAGESSSGTNLGPTSAKLILGSKEFQGIKQLAELYRKENLLAADEKVPVDAVTRSGSGLDPDISVANAQFQARRVSKARDLPLDDLLNVIAKNTEGRQFGFLGEPRVNVLMLNLSLDEVKQRYARAE
jgi:K+-transporting ATPase ATPase C chain